MVPDHPAALKCDQYKKEIVAQLRKTGSSSQPTRQIAFNKIIENNPCLYSDSLQLDAIPMHDALRHAQNFRNRLLYGRDDLLAALIAANLMPYSTRAKLSVTTRQDPLTVQQVRAEETRFVKALFFHLVNTESLPLKTLTENPDAICATIIMSDQNCSRIEKFVPNQGHLRDLIGIAEQLRLLLDCTFMSALSLSLASHPKVTNKSADDRTVKAVYTFLQIHETHLDPIYLNRKFKDLEWDKVKNALQEKFRPEIKERLGLTRMEAIQSYQYPEFCRTTRECKDTITKAAISIARMGLVKPKSSGFPEVNILWHTVPDPDGHYLPDAQYFTDGFLDITSLGK